MNGFNYTAPKQENKKIHKFYNFFTLSFFVLHSLKFSQIIPRRQFCKSLF